MKITLCAFADEAGKAFATQIRALQKHEISLLELRSIDGKNVMVYTGYLYEKIREAANPDWDALLAETNILIDGPYVEAERSLAIHFRGSRNQRVFFLSERGKEYKDRF